MTAIQAVSDLRWLLLSAPLLRGEHPRFAGQVFSFSPQQRVQIEQWLSLLQQRPNSLLDWLANSSPAHLARLGRYAEQLLEFFLRNGPTHQLVIANLPLRADPAALRGDHTTIGEIDYLLTDNSGQSWHWELAVKYFLCQKIEPATTANLIGPDAAETFDSKLDKLFLRQLRHKPPPPYNQVNWRPAAFTRGWMFYPLGSAVEVIDQLHPEHLRGGWLTLEQLEQANKANHFKNEQFLILDRQRWLSIAHCIDKRFLLDAHELAQEIAVRLHGPHASGVLVAQMQMNEDHSRELNRFFVVPNVWPEKSSAFL